MKPTLSDVHVDAALTRFAIGWSSPDLVATKVFPLVTVEKESDKYYVWDRGDFFRIEARIRADGTAAHASGRGLTTASYKAEEFALRDVLTDRTRDNADSVLRIREAKTAYVQHQVLAKVEKDFAGDFFKTGVWGTDKTLTGTDRWNDPASNPLDEIETGANTIRGKTGRKPNVGLMGPAVWKSLKFHPDLLNGIKHSGRGMARIDDFAGLTEIPTWYVAGGIETSSKEGATDAFADLFGKSCLLLFIDPKPEIDTPTAGFSPTTRPARVRRWRDEEVEGEWIEASTILDQVKVAADLGYFLATVVD